MSKTPHRYHLPDAVEVFVGDQRYFVFLASEIVVIEVRGRTGRSVLRRVTSRRIETAALLRASDKAHELGLH